MKNFKLAYLTILFVFGISTAFAQDNAAAPAAKISPDYYMGKWSVLIKGTPNGDVTVPMRFAMKDGKLMGYFIDPTSPDEKEMTTAEVAGNDINTSFSIAGYDVTMTLSMKDEEHANGKLMDMFECEGTRVKEEEKK